MLPVAIPRVLRVLLLNRGDGILAVPHVTGFAGKVAAARLIGGTTAEPLWVDGFAEVLRVEFHEGFEVTAGCMEALVELLKLERLAVIVAVIVNALLDRP